MLGFDLFESNTIGDDSTYPVSSTHFIAQSFTPGTAHNLFSFCFKLIKWGTPSDATIRIYNVDSNGKPTGAALVTMTIPTADIGTDTSWPYEVTSLLVNNTQLVAVLSGSVLQLELGVRYQSVGTYTSGKAWYSNDIGATWHELTGMSFLFQDWGQALPLYGTYRVPLYPTGEGTYNQLVGVLNDANKPNYSYVNDPIDAANDDPLNSVCYELCDVFNKSTDDDVFLSGLGDGAAGILSGTTLLWKSSVAGVWGDGTNFLSELAIDDILRSPSKNEWYTGTSLRLSKILSIQSDIAATLTDYPGGYTSYRDLRKAWFYFPNNTATMDIWSRNGFMLYGYEGNPDNLPVKFMPGKWTFTTDDDVVTAVGGNALSVYPDPDYIYNIITTGKSRGGNWYPCEHIDGDNQVTLWDEFELGMGLPGIHRVGLDGKTGYAYFGFQDDLSDDSTATQWANHEKFDSYAIKTTLNEGNIHRMYVKFRVCIAHHERTVGTSLTATAKPLLYLNGVFSYGVEQTITSTEADAIYWTGTEWNQPKVYEFEVIIGKPGGGIFTKDDLPDLEVGVVLGNFSDINKRMAVCCTQICLIAEVSNLPWYEVIRKTVGIDDVGFIAFNDKWDEFNQFVGEDGVNTMGWKVHSIISSLWISRPLRLIKVGLRKIFKPRGILRLRRR